MPLKEIKRPLKEIRSQFIAINSDPLCWSYEQGVDFHGPCESMRQLEELLKDAEPGEYLILTRVKEIRVS